MKRFRSGLIGCALMTAMFAMSTSATAAIVFEQLLRDPPSGVSARNSNGGGFGQQIAEDFSLAEPTMLTAVSWFGLYRFSSAPADETPRQFSLSIFADDAGVPGTPVFEQISTVGGVDAGKSNSLNEPILSYDLALNGAPPVLSANTTYWLSIMDDDVSTLLSWAWSYTNFEGPFALWFGLWTPQVGFNHAFALEGVVVPLPAPLAPMAVSLALFALIRRRTT